MITGMVCALGEPVRIRAKMNSFQPTRKQKIPAATMPGRYRQDDLPDRLQPGAAVDAGCPLQVGRQVLESSPSSSRSSGRIRLQ